MAAEVLNANPTIRSISDLPSRRKANHLPPDAVVKGLGALNQVPLGLFSSTIPSSAYTVDPFQAAESKSAQLSLSQISSVTPSHAATETEVIDEQEIFDLIAPISDPEHPLSLASLSVVNLPDISISPLHPNSPIMVVTVLITPTITHCSLATVIGLGVRVRLEQSLPMRYRVDVRIKEGTHTTADQVNRQLGDKERVAAALENGTLLGVLRKMLEGCSEAPGDQNDSSVPIDLL